MRKLLIIQQDETYFLLETLFTLDRYHSSLKDFEITVLVNPSSYQIIVNEMAFVAKGITTDIEEVLNNEYEISINLSLSEFSWPLHGRINAKNKIGPYEVNKQLFVSDAWSSYYLTLKGKAPFLTFHLQDFYKNILGIKKISPSLPKVYTYQKIVIGLCHTSFFSSEEQEQFINLLHSHYPQLSLKDLSEIDPVEDLSNVLYIGPASLQALRICEDGAHGVFLSSQFQGFNLLPHNEGHFFVSSKNSRITAKNLIEFIDAVLVNKEIPKSYPYAIYCIDGENLFGSYLRCLHACDENYPIYQAHVVLWNFILNLFDLNLEVSKCNVQQINSIRQQAEVVQKLIRLYDYAMSSIDFIYQEAKGTSSNLRKIEESLINLKEIETITDNISQSHSYLRPILDFYRIRRGQNLGNTLLEQSQHSLLLYSEEQQTLQAYLELITVTLRKNEVNI